MLSIYHLILTDKIPKKQQIENYLNIKYDKQFNVFSSHVALRNIF